MKCPHRERTLCKGDAQFLTHPGCPRSSILGAAKDRGALRRKTLPKQAGARRHLIKSLCPVFPGQRNMSFPSGVPWGTWPWNFSPKKDSFFSFPLTEPLRPPKCLPPSLVTTAHEAQATAWVLCMSPDCRSSLWARLYRTTGPIAQTGLMSPPAMFPLFCSIENVKDGRMTHKTYSPLRSDHHS